MSQAPESPSESTTVTGAPRADVPAHDDGRYGRSSRLNQAVAWVVIVAGVVFIVAVVFFSGFFVAWSSGDHYGHHRGYCPMMGPGGTMGPGGMMRPGQMGPGGMMPGGPMRPGAPTTTSPAASTPTP